MKSGSKEATLAEQAERRAEEAERASAQTEATQAAVAERVDHCREIASLGGSARMAQLTRAERRKMAALGGHAARDAIRKKYTPEELSAQMRERGRKGAAARWAKKNERPAVEAPDEELELEAALGW